MLLVVNQVLECRAQSVWEYIARLLCCLMHSVVDYVRCCDAVMLNEAGVRER